ncbi:hypothetical protein [Rhodanobacter glycinis]|nr:hypothetical protein [Rhodanobacter glycinis]
MRSFWFGCLIAPLAASLIFLLGTLAVSVIHDGTTVGLHDWQAALAAVTVFVLPMSYLATWILGVPFILWLRSSSHLTRMNICLGAVGVGVIAMLMLQLMAKVGPLHLQQVAFGALVSAGLALCVALTFCWIAKVPFASD